MSYNIDSPKQVFFEIVEKNIKREGIKPLMDFLEKSDFFTAPASTKFHSSYECGLCEHSIKVYNRFVKLLTSEYGENYQSVISDESVAIIALFHDVCKIDTYTIDYRNVKVDGVWVQKPYYAYADKMPYGHGEKSVYIVNGFLRLTREEAMCINWHMGGYDARVKGGVSLTDVFYMYPNALLFSQADCQASYLDEEL